MLTSVIDVKEYGYIGTIDIPKFFIQTPIERKPGEVKIKIKIERVLVDMLVHTDLEKYGPSVVYEKGKKVLSIEILKDIYGMLHSALL